MDKSSKTGQPGGSFSTSVFGFRKDEVLEYIDQMAAERMQTEQRQAQQTEQMQQRLDDAKEENERILAATREVMSHLQAERQRADQAGERIEQLNKQLQTAEDGMNTFRSRLFTREQEAVVLRSDNSRLNQALAEKQAELDALRARQEQIGMELEQAQDKAQAIVAQAEARAEELGDATRQQSEAMVARAREESESLRAEAQTERQAVLDEARAEAGRTVQSAEAEKQRASRQMGRSAQEIAASVAALKAQLAAVDEKIAAATADIQGAVGAISAALEQTGEGLAQLGVQVEKFPEPAEPVRFANAEPGRYASVKKQEAPAEETIRAAKQAVRDARTAAANRIRAAGNAGRQSMSELLLETLNRLLGEK